MIAYSCPLSVFLLGTMLTLRKYTYSQLSLNDHSRKQPSFEFSDFVFLKYMTNNNFEMLKFTHFNDVRHVDLPSR